MNTDDEIADRARRMDGASAASVRELPRPAWVAIGQRVQLQLKELRLPLLAAGVAFRLLLAAVPALIAAITLWGIAADPQTLVQRIQDLAATLPESGGAFVQEQLTALTDRAGGQLGTALAVSLAVALWSAASGMLGLVDGCSAAYGEVDTRSFLRRRGLALAMTLGGLVLGLLTILGSAALPALVDASDLGDTAARVAVAARWPVLGLLTFVAIAAVYRYGPDRRRAKLRWLWLGAAVATVLWLVGSALFGVYVERFGDFDATYGSLAGVVIVMLWVFLSSFAVLLGALLNAEVERQTQVDTTTGPERPIGTRDAQRADGSPGSYAPQQLEDVDGGPPTHRR
jgi:membrane protein